MGKKTVTVLGNCVAERLLLMLYQYPGFSDNFQIKRFQIVPYINARDLGQLADLALQCDIIFMQPLFNYGPCNTAEIRKRLRPRQELFVFSSPDFNAYFPDLYHLNHPEKLVSPRVMEWDSKILFSCYVNSIPIGNVEKIYTSHWLFHKKNMVEQLDKGLENYLKREQGVDLSTLGYFIKNFRHHKLLHSPRHPRISFLSRMCEMMVETLGIPKIDTPYEPEKYEFNYNQWPVITRQHDLFHFPEQAYFVINGNQLSIETVATAYYNFYYLHPALVEAHKHHAIALTP